MRLFLTAFFALVVCCALTGNARAQRTPLVEFDRAVFDVAKVGANVSNPITLTNSDSSITFQLENAPLAANRYAGAPLDLQIGFGSVSGVYSGIVNNVYYERLYYSGLFIFRPAQTLVYPFRYSRQKFAQVADVTLNGVLYIHDQPVANSQPIAKAQLNMRGTAVATLQFQNLTDLPDGVQKPYYAVRRIRYEVARVKPEQAESSRSRKAARKSFD